MSRVFVALAVIAWAGRVSGGNRAESACWCEPMPCQHPPVAEPCCEPAVMDCCEDQGRSESPGQESRSSRSKPAGEVLPAPPTSPSPADDDEAAPTAAPTLAEPESESPAPAPAADEPTPAASAPFTPVTPTPAEPSPVDEPASPVPTADPDSAIEEAFEESAPPADAIPPITEEPRYAAPSTAPQVETPRDADAPRTPPSETPDDAPSSSAPASTTGNELFETPAEGAPADDDDGTPPDAAESGDEQQENTPEEPGDRYQELFDGKTFDRVPSPESSSESEWDGQRLRQWRHVRGGRTWTARLAGVRATEVVLVDRGDETLTLSYEELSDGDLRFLRGQIEARQRQRAADSGTLAAAQTP